MSYVKNDLAHNTIKLYIIGLRSFAKHVNTQYGFTTVRYSLQITIVAVIIHVHLSTE